MRKKVQSILIHTGEAHNSFIINAMTSLKSCSILTRVGKDSNLKVIKLGKKSKRFMDLSCNSV